MRDPKIEVASVSSSVELFGALLGRLGRPFSERRRELAAAGIENEDELSRIQAAWIGRFTAGDEEARGLCTRFGAAHEAARAGATGAKNTTLTPVPALENPVAVPPAAPAPAPVIAPRVEGLPSYLLALLEAAPSALRPASPTITADETSDAIPIFRDPIPFSGRQSVDVTCEALPVLRDPLPFGDVTSAGFRATDPDPSPVSRSPTGDETMALPVLTDFGPSLPFGHEGSDDALPDFTVEQFASFCAELQARPERQAEIIGRYRCSADTVGRLYRAWTHRLAGDPALLARFRAGFARYQSWLLAQT